MFVFFNRSLPEPSKEDGKKQDGRCREQPSCPFETHFDDNIRDTVARMRMLHGDVVSQKFGPGVNFFAKEGRRFWVTLKYLAFRYKIASYCD